MDFRLSRHAEWEMARRGIPLELVQVVMDGPEQRVVDESGTGRWIHQSRLRFEDGKIYLLRAVVDDQEHPPVVVTVYRTSKIEKYWSAE
jgi:SH3-like domain-containing protein